MQKAEAKVLHGLYCHTMQVEGDVLCTPAELNWLVGESYRSGAEWTGAGNRLRSCDVGPGNYSEALESIRSHIEPLLVNLEASGMISFRKEGAFYRIRLLHEGKCVARELGDAYSRLKLQFREGVGRFFGKVVMTSD
jgi:hypothetical protein